MRITQVLPCAKILYYTNSNYTFNQGNQYKGVELKIVTWQFKISKSSNQRNINGQSLVTSKYRLGVRERGGQSKEKRKESAPVAHGGK